MLSHLIVKWLFLKLFCLDISPHKLAHCRAIFLWQLSTGLHHLPLFSQLRSPLFWPHGSMSSASLFSALITLFSIRLLSTLCPKVQILKKKKKSNVRVVFCLFWISAQWMCYFMQQVNWNCQTNAYLVWHLGSITLVSPSSVPVCLCASPCSLFSLFGQNIPPPRYPLLLICQDAKGLGSECEARTP